MQASFDYGIEIAVVGAWLINIKCWKNDFLYVEQLLNLDVIAVIIAFIEYITWIEYLDWI